MGLVSSLVSTRREAKGLEFCLALEVRGVGGLLLRSSVSCRERMGDTTSVITSSARSSSVSSSLGSDPAFTEVLGGLGEPRRFFLPGRGDLPEDFGDTGPCEGDFGGGAGRGGGGPEREGGGGAL